ncbi:MAG: amidohydrolase [Burkholderiales bacterium]|nr:amidohydrolase [Burkholderiales bacterium]
MAIVDTIFLGGSVLTMDERCPRAEALAVGDGRILAVGTRAQIERLSQAATPVVDLEGGVLMPGFIEAHGHPLTESLFGYPPATDVRPFFCPRYEDVVERIRARVAQAQPGELLFFRGLDLVLHRVPHDPTFRDLDAWSPQVPIIVQANPGHAAWANSAALTRLGLTRDTPDPPAGHYVRDAYGELTGKATESAVHEFLAPVLTSSVEDFRRRNLRELLRAYARRGLTMASDQAMPPPTAALYRAVAAAGDACIRIRAYVRGTHANAPFVPNEGDDTFRIIGVKFTADGSPWVGNIAVSDPYLNSEVTLGQMGLPPDNRGELNWTDELLGERIDRYARDGWQVSVHAHGDRAIAQVLRIYAAVIPRLGRCDHRLRIEHCGAITDEQLVEAARLGVAVSFFPAHVYWWGEAMRKDLFNLRVAERWMAMGSALRAGMRISLHNDGMVTPTDPLLNIRTAATRLTRAGNVLGPDQCITVAQALRAHTIDAAWQLFMEHETGSLVAGKSADLVWLDADPLAAAPERVHEIGVRGTWLRGVLTFTA